MNVLIAGAGIGGLTLGIALRERGHRVRILERRTSFAEEGAGIVLGPNVMAALHAVHLAEPVREAGCPVAAMNITDDRGRVLSRLRYQFPELPFPAIAIHRSRLHEILRQRYDGELSLGAAVDEIEVGAAPSVVSMGERFDADLVVGADGIRSRIRARLFPNLAIRASRVSCFRYVAEGRFHGEVIEMWGRGKRVGLVPLGADKTYVFLTKNVSAGDERARTTLEEFRAEWSDFGGPAPAALAALPSLDRLLHAELEDAVAPRFYRERVALLGDAAHAVTPNMGQGAGLAVEDALCLAHLVSESVSLPSALESYDRLRRPRATRIKDQSYSLGRLAQLESSPLRWLRNCLLRGTPERVNRRALRRIVLDMPGVPVRGLSI